MSVPLLSMYMLLVLARPYDSEDMKRKKIKKSGMDKKKYYGERERERKNEGKDRREIEKEIRETRRDREERVRAREEKEMEKTCVACDSFSLI